MPTYAQGFPADVAASKMTVPAGFKVELFAAEPQIRQPILVKHDSRGRLWTIQYLQYPNPAGLKRVSVDRWSRTVYDRIPEPPPHGPRGADKITICEDTDGDNVADKFTDFVDGLNLCTSIEFGNSGVYVLQPPYLLFYPDRDKDDIPDSDPQVLIEGFGMHDAQSLANHLTWGPDGWLYGVQGSTVTSQIRGIEFQQGVWRYHIGSDTFELFSEGGGNTFGLTFDQFGQLFQSTNGGPFLHVMPGSYFYKSFNKHGPLHNLFTYGYFSRVQRDRMVGGPPTGGTIYNGVGFPDAFSGRFIAGDFLGHNVFMWDISPDGSTVTAADKGYLLKSNDTWFGPTDICIGPDGSLYVSDFHDQRTSHPDPDASWDRSNGRIYRVSTNQNNAEPKPLIGTEDAEALFRMAIGGQHWQREQARIALSTTASKSIPRQTLKDTRERFGTGSDLNALNSIWALNACNNLTPIDVSNALAHTNEHVVSWGIRLALDKKMLTTSHWRTLHDYASRTESPIVGAAIAESIRRSREGIGLLHAFLANDAMAGESRVPFLTWWAIENRISLANAGDLRELTTLFAETEMWDKPLFQFVATKVIRRLSFGVNVAELNALAHVLKAVKVEHQTLARDALRQGLQERSNVLGSVQQGTLFTQFAEVQQSHEAGNQREVPTSKTLNAYVVEQIAQNTGDAIWLEIGMILKQRIAEETLRASITNGSPLAEDVAVGIILPFLSGMEAIDLASHSMTHSFKGNARLAVHRLRYIEVLSNENASNMPQIFATSYEKLTADEKLAFRTAMLSRREWAIHLMEAVDAGRVPKEDIQPADLRVTALHDSPELNELIQKHYGSISAGTKEQTLALMRKYNNDLRHSGGSVEVGKELFTKHCAVCHTLFGKGEKIGPDLTNENRQDRAALLANIVDPSAVIKRDYLPSIITTKNGQVISGIISNRTGDTITLVDTQRKQHSVMANDVDMIQPSSTSLMPENLMKEFTPEQVRSLFKYLQSGG